jgi:ABC-type Zn uptake system ZnuABC Zn-binding protein ZnuA
LELLRALDLKDQDGHIWYSPKLLRNIIEQISESVIAIDPVHTELYQANTQTLQQAIVDWAQFTENQFASAKPQYLLDHDFLVHFQADFQLKALATIHDSHDQHGGIQAMQLIEKQLGESAVKCLITNESNVSKIGRNLADKFSLSVYHIVMTNSFIDHLYHLTETLAKCR